MMPTAPTRTPQRRAADGYTTTEKCVGAWAAILVLFEFYLIATKQQLVTQAVIEMSKKYPIIAVAMGLLLGHFYWGAQAVMDDIKGRE